MPRSQAQQPAAQQQRWPAPAAAALAAGPSAKQGSGTSGRPGPTAAGAGGREPGSSSGRGGEEEEEQEEEDEVEEGGGNAGLEGGGTRTRTARVVRGRWKLPVLQPGGAWLQHHPVRLPPLPPGRSFSGGSWEKPGRSLWGACGEPVGSLGEPGRSLGEAWEKPVGSQGAPGPCAPRLGRAPAGQHGGREEGLRPALRTRHCGCPPSRACALEAAWYARWAAPAGRASVRKRSAPATPQAPLPPASPSLPACRRRVPAGAPGGPARALQPVGQRPRAQPQPEQGPHHQPPVRARRALRGRAPRAGRRAVGGAQQVRCPRGGCAAVCLRLAAQGRCAGLRALRAPLAVLRGGGAEGGASPAWHEAGTGALRCGCARAAWQDACIRPVRAGQRCAAGGHAQRLGHARCRSAWSEQARLGRACALHRLRQPR
jgi:hypothetical protein